MQTTVTIEKEKHDVCSSQKPLVGHAITDDQAGMEAAPSITQKMCVTKNFNPIPVLANIRGATIFHSNADGEWYSAAALNLLNPEELRMRQIINICLTFLFVLSVLKVGVLAAEDKPTLSGEEIINRYLVAAGGKQALTKFKSRVALGTFTKEGEPEARMAIMSEAPDRVAAVYVFRDYDWRLIYTGGSVIIRPQFPRQVSAIEDKYREMLASGLMFNGISLQNLLTSAGSDVKYTAKGTKKVKGRQAYIVEMKRGKESPLRLYFDAESFMWVRTDFGRAEVTRQMRTFTNDVVNQGASEATIDFYIETSDFRDVDGVKLPFRVEMVVTSPILREKSVGTIVGNIVEYKHDVPIDPKMFQ